LCKQFTITIPPYQVAHHGEQEKRNEKDEIAYFGRISYYYVISLSSSLHEKEEHVDWAFLEEVFKDFIKYLFLPCQLPKVVQRTISQTNKNHMYYPRDIESRQCMAIASCLSRRKKKSEDESIGEQARRRKRSEYSLLIFLYKKRERSAARLVRRISSLFI